MICLFLSNPSRISPSKRPDRAPCTSSQFSMVSTYIASNHLDSWVPSPLPEPKHIHAGNAIENLRTALSDSR